MEDLEQTSRLFFHSAAYVITTSVSAGSTLRIEAEAEDGGARWSGDFSSRYVENITQKTGSAKKFPVFVKMLMTALGHGSESVFVDLLTYADLEQLKARRADTSGNGSPQHQSSQGVTATDTGNGNINGNKKRYLILTYVGEYDRVHYPLPLACVEPPSKEPPEQSADGLLREMGTVEGSPRESPAEAQLRAENEDLRRQMEDLVARFEDAEAARQRETGGGNGAQDESVEDGDSSSDAGAGGHNVRRKRQAHEKLQTQLDDLQESYERLRVDSAAEIRKLKREVREATKAADLESTRAAEAVDEAAALREELEDSEQRLHEAEDKHREEIGKLKKELAKERVTGRAMRAKIQELSSGRRIAPETRRAYQQQQQRLQTASGKSPSSSVARRGGFGAGSSSVERTRGVSRSRRGGGGGGASGDSSGTNRSRSSRRSRVVRSPAISKGRNPSTAGASHRGWGLGLGRHSAVTATSSPARGRAGSPRYRSAVSRLSSSRAGSRASSRGSSPASSRGRSRSTSISRRRGGDGKGLTPVFDPTAYQRDREARRRRMEEERKRRERGRIGYSPGRGSGRDSWIPWSGGNGPTSSAGVERGRSAVREGGRGSGYLSAGSQASQASSRPSSRGSSVRSGLSRSGQSSDASSTIPARSRPRGRSPRKATAAAETARGDLGYARHTSTSQRSIGLSDLPAPPPPPPPLPRPSTSTRLRRNEARLRGRNDASPGRAGRHYDGAGGAMAAANGRNSPRLHPKKASSSPKNYRKHGVSAVSRGGSVRITGRARYANSAGDDGPFLRDSGNSSMVLSGGGEADAEVDSFYPPQDTAGRWVSGGDNSGGFLKRDTLRGREAACSRRDSEDREDDEDIPPRRREAVGGRLSGAAPVRRSEEPAMAIRVPSTAAYDDDDGAGKRRAARSSSYAEGIPIDDGLGDHARRSVVSSWTDDRRHHRQEGVITEEVISGGATLGSSGGSTGSVCSSSQRSGRRRVELRTPVEETAVRKSQELNSPLSSMNASKRRDSALSDEGTTPSLPAPTQHPAPSAVIDPGGKERGHHHLSQLFPAERTTAGAEASPEISDIDRRLGELHEFLRRAKGGGGVGGGGDGGIPVPALPSRRAAADVEDEEDGGNGS